MRAAVYHPISLALLSLDLALVAPTALQFARQWRSLHIVVFAGGLGTLLADAAMVANFWPRELYFVLNDFDLDVGSPWCKASAVWTIASLFSLGVSSVVTAVVTRRSVSFGPQRFVSLRALPQPAALRLARETRELAREQRVGHFREAPESEQPKCADVCAWR
jgi:hypothetical protein